MRSWLRRLGFVLWLALAFALGQQASVLHDLGHATERLSHDQDSGTAPAKCDQHFTCNQLASAVGATPPVTAFLAATPPRSAVQCERSATCAPRFAYRSRAPPVLL